MHPLRRAAELAALELLIHALDAFVLQCIERMNCADSALGDVHLFQGDRTVFGASAREWFDRRAPPA